MLVLSVFHHAASVKTYFVTVLLVSVYGLNWLTSNHKLCEVHDVWLIKKLARDDKNVYKIIRIYRGKHCHQFDYAN